MNMKLEVAIVPVSDVDRAKVFYEKLGWRLDIDYTPNERFRVLQFTPPGSGASIIFGKGITSAKPRSFDHLVLAVNDVDAVRDDLIKRGVKVSEVFHYAGGPFNNAADKPHVPTSRLLHSAIPTATVGCCKKSRSGSQAECDHGRCNSRTTST